VCRKKSPEILNALKELLEDTVAGDPVSGLKWTHRSLRKLQKALRRRGIRLALATIARLLRRLGFSLKTCRKQQAGTQDPDRDRQFRYIVRMRKLYLEKGLPVISVDTMKKEWVGNFKNAGRCWRRRHRKVLDHDFPRWALGQAIPVGIYDVGHNDGYVVVGTSHATAAFITAAIRRWWRVVGRRRYPGARRLLLEMDGGGANDPRTWLWRVALQDLADETGLVIVVTHYPPGASKWNPIEHRMFSVISGNWAGEPLVSYETIVKHIRTARTETGFRCRACLDRKDYPARQRAAPKDKTRVQLKPSPVLPKWNYTIWPHRPHAHCRSNR
jgi:Rhodopirellula transposase DDE domain